MGSSSTLASTLTPVVPSHPPQGLSSTSAAVVSSIFQHIRKQAEDYQRWCEQASRISASLASSLEQKSTAEERASQAAPPPLTGAVGISSGFPEAEALSANNELRASDNVLQQLLMRVRTGSLQPTTAIAAAAAAALQEEVTGSAQGPAAQTTQYQQEAPVPKLIRLTSQLAAQPGFVSGELVNAIDTIVAHAKQTRQAAPSASAGALSAPMQLHPYVIHSAIAPTLRDELDEFVKALCAAAAEPTANPDELSAMLKTLIGALGTSG